MTGEIIRCAREAGAVTAAFAPCHPVDDQNCAIFDSWLESGNAAGLEYMRRYGDIRRDPRLLLDGAKSILCCAFPYGQSHNGSLFSDYALGDDYHEVLRRRLTAVASMMESLVAGSATRICVDTAPIRERYWAQQAGIGFIGLNNQLIVPGVGSKVFLAEVLWTSAADYGRPVGNDCVGCGACVRCCPGKALDGRGHIDCRKCLSYLTIEHRDELPTGLRLNDKIYGCDICQDVCPHNRHTVSPLPEFLPRPAVVGLTREDISAMTQEQFSAIFTHSAVKRAKLAGLQRNAKQG